MIDKMIKEAALQIKDECIKAQEELDKRTQQKCAQVILAASGLTLLKSKMNLTTGER